MVSTGSTTGGAGSTTGGSSRPTDEVETTLFRALAVLRLVVLVYAVVLNTIRWDEFARPVLGWVVVGGLVVWTGLATWLYDAPHRRRLATYVVDVVIACLAILSTGLVHSEEMLARHASTMPSFWVMAAVLAVAVGRGWVPGLVAAGIVSLCDLSVRLDPTGTTWGNIFLLLLAASVVGYTTQQLREATAARAEAERVAAAMRERARLARVVHDGVLQVLALVQRRGPEIGGEAGDLGRLAAEQEARLRSLVQADAAAAQAGPEGGSADLVQAVMPLATGSVTVTGPGSPVLLPGAVVAELASVVRACLDNVVRHVGEDAPAWVLVEDFGDAVVLSVRDEGPGIAPGRLDAARAEGRLGVSESVRGRVEDLGGSVMLLTGPDQGSEWELTIPR